MVPDSLLLLAQNAFQFALTKKRMIGITLQFPIRYSLRHTVCSCFRWVSKMVKKKFKSSVVCLSFHPSNGQVLATGSTDFRCRVYSTYNPEVDGSTQIATPFTIPLAFGEVLSNMRAYCTFLCFMVPSFVRRCMRSL